MPEYLSDMLLMCAPSRSVHSPGSALLVVPRLRTGPFGEAAFSVYGPRPVAQKVGMHYSVSPTIVQAWRAARPTSAPARPTTGQKKKLKKMRCRACADDAPS